MRRGIDLVVVVGLAVAGCDASDPPDQPDGGTGSGDAPAGDADPCAPPALEAPWLDTQLRSSITALTATPRATFEQRDATRAYLMRELAAFGWTVSLQSYAGGANVVADVPATSGAAPRIVVGAHFDTVDGSPGASDNATGVAVVLAVGRYLQAAPCRGRPVSLVLFDQEELGLFGSRSYAQSLVAADVRAVHTIDQVGWDADGDRRFELELPTPDLETAWRSAATALAIELSTTSTGGTDHESFRDEGLPAVGLSEEYVAGDTSPHRHATTDTAATVDFAYLALAAKLTARVVLDDVAAR